MSDPMRTITILVAVLALAFMVFPRGQSQTSPNQWPSTGPTCSAFLQSSGSERDVLVSFVVGFLAGTNRERNGQDQVMWGVDEIETILKVYLDGRAADQS